ncbi:MAG: hypothetical protein LBQ61_00630, partial [Spirochaetales bacterium]|nr:hypothetical protein [Spirochaetales bacterium]
GHSREQAKTIFELLEPFSEYGFNKSHAAAYSVLAYRTAYLKAHYPAQFMAANLSNEISDRDKMSDYIRELKKMDLTLAPPDINASDKSFTVQENRILYGLVGIKNVGEAAVEEILSSRKKDGPFLSLTDFLRRLDLRVVNRKVVEALIQAGAFDAMGMGRARLFSNLDRLIQFVEGQKESLSSGQNSLFDEDHREFTEIELSPVPEYPRDILLAHEKELLGYYASGHPLEPYRELWEKLTTLDLRIFGGRGEGSEEEEGPEESSPGNLIPGAPYTLVGLASGVKTRFTKSGGKMATAMIEDFNGSLEMLFFPKAWGETEDRVKNDAVLVVTGKVDQSRNNPQFLVDEVKSPEESLRGLKAFEPLEPYRNLYGSEKILSLGERELSQAVPGAAYTLLGILRNLRTFTSKKGEAMAQGTLEDFFGRMDLLFFPRIWEKEEENIREGRILGVSGKIDHFRNARQFLVNQVISPENLGALPARRERGGRKGADKPKKAPAGNAPALHIRLLRERINPDSLEELREFLLPHQGESPIFFHVPRKAPEGTGEDVVIRASRRIAVHLDSLNLKALEEHPLTGDVWKE